MTILNVNDHEATRYLVTRLLAQAGFAVEEASTGEEALLLSLRQPELVVLDVKLPDISGLEVCRMIKSRPETASVFVLQTSATFTSSERRVQGLDSGADGYLTHPFEPAELIATVHSLMRLKAAETALRQRADALVEANRKKDQFLAMLSHELRNPLAAISNGVELLERAYDDRARFLRTRDVLRRQSRHLARLIDDLLDVSRITRDRIELRREPCGVRSVVDEVLHAHAGIVAARGLSVFVEVPQHLLVLADATRFHQIVSNLIDNACKYNAAGGSVRVSAELRKVGDGDVVVVTVSDDGVGMSAEFLPHAFDLFVQADDSLDRAAGGLGIGLTLVKRLAELHGGETRARSPGLGRGSTLEVWLPAAAAP